MKKIVICVTLLAMLASLAACGSKTIENREQAVSVKGTEQTSKDSAKDLKNGEDSSTDTLEASENKEDENTDAELFSGETDVNNKTENKEDSRMKISAGNKTFTADFADNSSAEALKELLAQGPLTIQMHDYANMEKVGPIGTSLPRNDEQITIGAGDIILYQGNSLVIYYDTNSWNFTRIGKIDGVTGKELLEAFGYEDVAVTFSLE